MSGRGRCRMALATAACALLAALLAGCANVENCTPVAIPALQHAGVRKVVGLSSGGQFDLYARDMTAFVAQRNGISATYILVNNNAGVNAIDLSSGAVRSLDLSAQCVGAPSVTPDQQWFACDTYGGIRIAPLVLSAPLQTHLLVRPAQDDGSSSVAWAPDSLHFALFDNGVVDLYLANATYTAAQLTAQLDVRAVSGCATTGAAPCRDSQLSWSPDGKWLAYVANVASFGRGTIYAVNLAPLLPVATTVAAHPLTTTLTSTSVLMVATTAALAGPVWQPGTSLLTYVDTDGASILTRALPSGAPTVLLHQQTVTLGQIAWTPDGHNLACTALGPYFSPQATAMRATAPLARMAVGAVPAARLPSSCAGPLPDLYVYTPPAG